jgi:hypothetical protein
MFKNKAPPPDVAVLLETVAKRHFGRPKSLKSRAVWGFATASSKIVGTKVECAAIGVDGAADVGKAVCDSKAVNRYICS